MRLESARIKHGRRSIIEGLSFELGNGITALLGPNGAGKSTLIEALADPRRLASGQLFVAGHEVTGEQARLAFCARFGYMPQKWRGFPGFTALECVEYTAWLKGVSSKAVTVAAEAALGLVGLSSEKSAKVSRMSGGMQQRVGLAEALVNDPEFLLLDEPTVGLDPEQRATFREVLHANSQERAVLFSTHLTDDVLVMADRVLLLRGGQLLFDGTPRELEQYSDGRPGATLLESGYLTVLKRNRAASE